MLLLHMEQNIIIIYYAIISHEVKNIRTKESRRRKTNCHYNETIAR